MRLQPSALWSGTARRRTGRNEALLAGLVVWSLMVAACSSAAGADEVATTAETTAETGPDAGVHATVEGEQVVLEYGGKTWDFLTGVNLGATIPGHYPGELAIDAETYRRWFPMMTELGFVTVRVYTIQNPDFYRELRAYNLAHPDRPLFLIQGVWIDEERFLETRDLYDEQLTASFDEEISDAVAAVTGSIELPARSGHAHGSFTADVGDWVAAWIVGIELDPVATRDSDVANLGAPVSAGRYFRSHPAASPTEAWYAARLDRLASELAAAGLQMPLAFSNWPTTDPLAHPEEPIVAEDLVGIDANHVEPTPQWPAGYFASYHAYPYFPDFQKHEPGIADYVHDGRVDPYAGYLAALQRHHAGLPVVVAEFGVSGGMALAHRGPRGRNQGALNEPEQMAIDAELLTVIHDVGLAGGLLFAWADEWFKFSWNTIDYELPPDRRALWDNPWTNEAQFGVLALEPGPADGIVLDGDGSDWADIDAAVLRSAGDGPGVVAHHDPGYLYLKIDLTNAGGEQVTVGFDVVPGASGGLPGTSGVMPQSDVAVRFGPGDDGEALIRATNDPFGIGFGLNAGYVDVDPADYRPEAAVWNRQQLLTSHPLQIPTTGEHLPAERFDVGILVRGTSDPTSPAFDSRAVWARDADTIEARIPYASLGISDPSSRRGWLIALDGTVSTAEFDRIAISLLVDDHLYDTSGYAWEPWVAVEWHERLRVGSEALAAVNRAVLDGD